MRVVVKIGTSSLTDAGGRIDVGAPADLCLFDPLEDWIVGPRTLVSQGKNTPFSGLPMVGRVRHTVVGGEPVFSRAG